MPEKKQEINYKEEYIKYKTKVEQLEKENIYLKELIEKTMS